MLSGSLSDRKNYHYMFKSQILTWINKYARKY